MSLCWRDDDPQRDGALAHHGAAAVQPAWRWAPAWLVERMNSRLSALAGESADRCCILARQHAFRLLHRSVDVLSFFRPAPDSPATSELLLADLRHADQPRFHGAGHGIGIDAAIRRATWSQILLPRSSVGATPVAVWATSAGWWGAADDGATIGPLANRDAVIRAIVTHAHPGHAAGD